MSDADALARRLETVEAALAHQERIVADLDKVVVEQWQVIDRLSRRVEMLVDRLGEAEARLRQAGPPEPPPPHY